MSIFYFRWDFGFSTEIYINECSRVFRWANLYIFYVNKVPIVHSSLNARVVEMFNTNIFISYLLWVEN